MTPVQHPEWCAQGTSCSAGQPGGAHVGGQHVVRDEAGRTLASTYLRRRDGERIGIVVVGTTNGRGLTPIQALDFADHLRRLGQDAPVIDTL